MKTIKNAQPLDISVFGMALKVFRIGQTPGIKYLDTTAQNPAAMKSIHSHFTYEVFFVTEGELELVTETQSRIYERKILIIPPKIRHYSVPSSVGSYCLLFSFEDTSRWRTLAEEHLRENICQLPLSDESAFYIRKIAEKCSCANETSEKEIMHLASLLFYEILGGLFPQWYLLQDSGKGNTKHIYEIEHYINGHLKEKILLSDIAAHISLSPRQVSRVINKEYGCSLTELVTDKRLASAEILIKNTAIPISEIAKQTNLGSENYFYTLFKKRYGISPLQYRKTYGK